MKDLDQMNVEVFTKLNKIAVEFLKRMKMPENSDQNRYTFDTAKKLHVVAIGASRDFHKNLVLVNVIFGKYGDATKHAEGISGPVDDMKDGSEYIFGLEFDTYTDKGCKSSVAALPISPETLYYVDECFAMLKQAFFGYLSGAFKDRAEEDLATKAPKQGSKRVKKSVKNIKLGGLG